MRLVRDVRRFNLSAKEYALPTNILDWHGQSDRVVWVRASRRSSEVQDPSVTRCLFPDLAWPCSGRRVKVLNPNRFGCVNEEGASAEQT